MLLELIRPALVLLDEIPAPQAVAMEAALALRPPAAQDRFAVGAATLSLLAAYAEQAPVAVLVDDAQWPDGSSAGALLFAFRRMVADPIAVLVTVREGEPSLLDGADLPVLRLGGLSIDEAAALAPGLSPEAVRRLYQATAGNPLALRELAADAGDLMLAPDGAPVHSVHPAPARCGLRSGSAADGHRTPASFRARVIRAAECPASRCATIYRTTCPVPGSAPAGGRAVPTRRAPCSGAGLRLGPVSSRSARQVASWHRG